MSHFIPLEEAANILGVTVRTLRRMRQEGGPLAYLPTKTRGEGRNKKTLVPTGKVRAFASKRKAERKKRLSTAG